jgi:biotin carboxylase
MRAAGFPIAAVLDRALERPEPLAEATRVAVPGNRIEVELDNARARTWLLEAIAGSRRSVSLQVYMALDDEIGRAVDEALGAAAARGVTVRVLVDSLHGLHGSFGAENPLLARLAARPGVDLRVGRPLTSAPSLADLKQRDHRKLVIVDDRVALVGGRNLSHEYYTGFDEVPLVPSATWRHVPWLDAGARVEGPAVGAIAAAFVEAWCDAGGDRFDVEPPPPVGSTPATVVVHRGLRDAATLDAYLELYTRHFDVAGPDVDTAERFRDKARMKDVLRANGLPCARHKLIAAWADAEAFVAEVGLPIVLKPPAGMACKATWRIRSTEELRQALEAVRVSPQNPTLAEEFLKGREFSFETITVGGEVRFHSVSHYFPGPLEVMENPWIQWAVVLPRVLGPEYDEAREMGFRAVRVLGLETGVTHMEWFQREDGSLAIGEIAARPPGAHIVRLTGLAHDADIYRAWARAVVDEAFDGPWPRRWATGCAYLRGSGRGRVVRVTGVAEANERVGNLVAESRLPTIGAPKSDSYEGDGHVILRHEDTEVVKQALKVVIETIRVDYA